MAVSVCAVQISGGDMIGKIMGGGYGVQAYLYGANQKCRSAVREPIGDLSLVSS